MVFGVNRTIFEKKTEYFLTFLNLCRSFHNPESLESPKTNQTQANYALYLLPEHYISIELFNPVQHFKIVSVAPSIKSIQHFSTIKMYPGQ